MASSIPQLLNKLRSTIQINSQSSIRLIRTAFIYRSYSRKTSSDSNSLFTRISPLGDPNVSLVPVLDKWLDERKKVKHYELQHIVRHLRGSKRYRQALEVSEWMRSKELFPNSTSDRAVQLDLIGKVRGVKAAENYFNSIETKDKVEKIYGALLNCYVRGGLFDKSLSHMKKMKEMGFATTPLLYNNIMCLYATAGKFEKIPDILSEMKENSVSPDNFSYRICINSYGSKLDFENINKVLEEIESRPDILIDPTTYASVANFYIKAGFVDKALIFLKKSEEKLRKNDAEGYNHLISIYATLGNKTEVMRLWDLQKTQCKKQINRDYITMLRSLVKLDAFEEAEKVLKDWESSCKCFDLRVPNVLLIGYCHKGMVGKAEKMLREMVENGNKPLPNSWGILADGYVDDHDLEKAFECMKEAFLLLEGNDNKGWRPKPRVISSILKWFKENGNILEESAFVKSLETDIYLGSVKIDDHENTKDLIS